VLFSEGTKIVFCFALALLKFHKTELMTQQDAVAISMKLKQIATDCHQCNSILMVAYHEMKAIRMEKITDLRQKYKGDAK